MSNKQVLVVEDHAMILEFVRDLLEANGHDVVTATNGREGIERMTGKIDLVVTDWHMPEKNGEDVLHHLRNTLPGVPAMIISATWDEATRRRIAALAPDAMMEKPLDAQEFIRIVDRLLGR